MFLMSLPRPTPAITAAIEAAVVWMDRTRITDHAWGDPDGGGRRLHPSPRGHPLWARLYEIGTDQPIFGDRDETIHYAVEEISAERRNGYSWYVDGPAKALAQLPTWRTKTATP